MACGGRNPPHARWNTHVLPTRTNNASRVLEVLIKQSQKNAANDGGVSMPQKGGGAGLSEISVAAQKISRQDETGAQKLQHGRLEG